MGQKTELEPREKGGLDRRTLIKRAAVAGAVAWTAPVIIGSLTSPASALTTGPHGCNSACFNGGNCGFDNTSLCGTVAGCSVNSNVLVANCLSVSSSTGKCEGSGTVTVSVLGACACKIVGWTFNEPGSGCQVTAVSPPATTITIPTSSAHINQTCITIDCAL